jgi:hypothetical protein
MYNRLISDRRPGAVGRIASYVRRKSLDWPRVHLFALEFFGISNTIGTTYQLVPPYVRQSGWYS